MRTPILFCLLALFVVGCDPMAFRSVYVQLPATTGQTSVSQSKVVLSADQADVQEALRIIDSVVTSGGLICTPPRQPKPGLLILYNTPTGPKNPVISCWVFLTGDSLSVVFSEFGRMRSSTAVRQMCDLLRDRLSSRYGADKVTVGH